MRRPALAAAVLLLAACNPPGTDDVAVTGEAPSAAVRTLAVGGPVDYVPDLAPRITTTTTTTTMPPTTTTTTTAPPPPATAAPAPTSTLPPAPAPTGSVWDRLAACESNGNWHINTGNGYSGGLQFHPDTWRRAGGQQYAPEAYQATREQQIAVAESWLARTSWDQWPACSRQIGVR